MRKYIVIHIVFVIFLLLTPYSLLLTAFPVRAQQNDPNELTKQIQEYEQKLKDLAGQKQTLGNAIVYLNTQIALTQTKIAQTEQTLVVLARDIDELVARIDRLNTSLDTLSTILIERVRESYKQERIEPLYLFFASTGFTDFVNQVKYIRAAQLHDRELMVSMERTRSTYDIQKQELVRKQDEVEALNATLKKQRASLATQQQEKQQFLEVTKNDEKKFQDLLSKARAELAAIQNIIAGRGEETKVGDVEEGNKIASIIPSTSACSTGAHLHYEIAKDNSHQNPEGYLRSANLSYDYDTSKIPETVNPSGSWRWPLDEPITITQIYGTTFWTRYLHYDFHTGIDMKKNGDAGAGVFATSKGTLYRGSVSCGGGTLRYVRVDHGDNLSTYYLHVNYI